MKKRVLIITYYWPPSGGIGVLRCLKMAKYLRDFGWEPIIYTAKNAHYPSIDHSNDKDVPEGLEIIKKPIIEPYTFYKLLTGQKKDANVNNVFYTKEENLGFMHKLSVWIRSNFFIPDARYLWIKPSVKTLEKYINENQVDAMLTCGPPHSNTRIATLLSKKTGTPWLMDFQDPWTQVDYYALLNLTKWGDRKHRRQEQEAFKQANKTTIVSPSWKKELEEIGAKNVSVHYWGYDPADYTDLKSMKSSKFSLVHIGIMGYDRNPKVFFEVVKELCNENNEFKESIEIILVGQVDYSVKESYEKQGLEKYISNKGSVPRAEALRFISLSPVLLLLLNQQENALGRVPGKLFEYLAVRKSILCLGPENSDVANILRTSKSGATIEYDNHTKIKSSLLDLFHQWKSGELDKPINSNIEEYSHINLTRKIAGYLDEITQL
jgi:hypothetical protein